MVILIKQDDNVGYVECELRRTLKLFLRMRVVIIVIMRVVCYYQRIKYY